MSELLPFLDTANMASREQLVSLCKEVARELRDHESAKAAASAEGRREGLLEAAACLSEMAVQTPVGHESKKREESKDE